MKKLLAMTGLAERNGLMEDAIAGDGMGWVECRADRTVHQSMMLIYDGQILALYSLP